MTRTYYLRTAALLSVCAITLAGCAPSKPISRTSEVVRGLTVAQVREAEIPDVVDATGTLQAKESAILSSQMVGRVTSVAVHEGDSVHAGELLVSLDATEAHSEVARAQANVVSSQHEVELAQTEANLANSTLARYQILRDRKSVSPQEFDEIQRKAQAASARTESAQAQLASVTAASTGSRTIADYAHIRAPFAGVVTARRVDPGTLATLGMPLLEVEKAGSLQLNVTVDESLLQTIQKSMTIPVVVADLPQPNIQGRIAEIDPAADPASRTFLVKIDLPISAGLRSGMSGTAKISTKDRSALLIPAAAIVTHGSIHGAWVLDNAGLASLRYVTLGAQHGDAVEVLSGMSTGETVVLSPADRELGGRKIEASR
jgi:RND family efflux transporter MFP subunit